MRSSTLLVKRVLANQEISFRQASGYDVDFEDWHAEVHGTLPYEKYIKPDPKMKTLLDSIPVPKYIFTNADLKHAELCLDLMGLRSCFQGIICFESIMKAAELQGMVHHNKPVICKPNRQAFELALKEADNAEIATTAFFDDSTRNIAASHRMGIFSVLISRVGVDCASDVQMRSMYELKEHLPWLVEVGDGAPVEDRVPVPPCLTKNEAVEELLEEAHLTALSVRA
jgi:pyrimidine and pyridine-specific 5'-nucleotidase